MIDTKSETWETLSIQVDQEIAATSRKLDQKNSDYPDTQFNRGFKAALLWIKELPHKDKVKPIEIDNYF